MRILHHWTYTETYAVTVLYLLYGKNSKEISKYVPDISISSIKCKLANCRYIHYGNIRGSLNHATIMHSLVWKDIHNDIFRFDYDY